MSKPSILLVFLSIPFTILFIPFMILIFLPLKIYTKFIKFLAHLVDPDMGKMLVGLTACQGRDFDEIHVRPGTTQVACLRFCGNFEFSKIKKKFEQSVILRLDKSNPYPTLHYPELQQYFHLFCGYLFLKKDRKFDINNHFVFYNKESPEKKVTHQDIVQIWESLLIKPFVRKQSPWEITIIDNYVPDQNELETWSKSGCDDKADKNQHYWLLMIRVHHALGDGYSIQTMLSELADNPFQIEFTTKITPYQNFLLNLRAFTLGPYDLLQKLYYSREDFHDLHRPFSEHAREYFVIDSNLFSTERVTRIRKRFGVPFTVILISLISGGFRKYFLTYKKPLPKLLSAAIPFATVDHSDKFLNDFSLTTVSYAIHLEDPVQRVQHANNQFKSFMSTSDIKMSDFFIETYGLFPLRGLRKMCERQFYCSTYSTMPGPKEAVNTFGCKLLEVSYAYGTSVDSAGFGISTLTYNGNFRFILFADRNVIKSRVQGESIVRFITEEFDVLENYYDKSLNNSSKHVKLKPSNIDNNFQKSMKYD